MSDQKPFAISSTLSKRKKRTDITGKPTSKNLKKLKESDKVPLLLSENLSDKAGTEELHMETVKISDMSERIKDEFEKMDPDIASGDEKPREDPSAKSKISKYEIEESNQISEFYLDIGYAFRANQKEQYYAKDENNNEIYFKDPTQDEIYATKTVKIGENDERIEFPAKLNDGKESYIYERGAPRYPENLETHELIFPVDPVTNEEIYLPNSNGEIRYPSNTLGMQYYRKNMNDDEVPISEYEYAKDASGSEFYPRYSNGDQYYLKDKNNDCEIGACKFEENECVPFYARKNNGDEFYPRQWKPSEPTDSR